MSSTSRPTRRGIVIGASAAVLAPIVAAGGLPAGSSRFTADVATAERRYAVPVHVHMPKGGADLPVVIVMHGVGRNAGGYRDQWRDLADTHDLVVVVPEFSKADFPGREAYNFGGMVTAEGQPKPRASWTFELVDQVFRRFVAVAGSSATGYDLYGHSAGAQFAHRFALFGSSPLARRIISANAGAYAWPSFDRPYPYGLGGTALTSADLTVFLKREGVVLLGDADVDPHHSSLPKDPMAAAQGPHRFARGQAFYRALQAASIAVGGPLGWRLEIVPGVDHSNSGMAAAAARLLSR